MLAKKLTQFKWYLLYTNPRFEKRAAEALRMRGFEVFLPIQKVLRQWSDRKKWVEEPLFNSYLFINIDINESYQTVMNVPGIVSFVKFEKHPAIVDVKEINFLRESLDSESANLELYNGANLLDIGSELEIIHGVLKGYKAKLVSYYGHQKMLLELVSIKRQVLVSVPNGVLKSKSSEMLLLN